MIIDKPELDTSFTSTGEKLYYHQEAMQALRDGRGMPISCWIAPTDVCNAKCGFCSVGQRPQDVLPFRIIKGFLDQLVPLGLKSVTWSGGGNMLLWRCKETGKNCNDLIDYAHDELGLECAVISNGMPLVEYSMFPGPTRRSWKNMHPDTLDKLTWCRISMAGIDHNHKEQEVFIPDFDPSKTTLGLSWIMADSFEEPTHKHGWVSTPDDVVTPGGEFVDAKERLPWIEDRIRHYVEKHNPAYVRLLSDCLRPDLIPERHAILSDMAVRIDGSRVFSQNKPPRMPVGKCYKILTRPCLNADSFVYNCDSVVLNRTAGHKFGSAWRVCTWEQVGDLMQNPSKYTMPENICPGCVFPDQQALIREVVENHISTPLPSGEPPQHLSFV